MARGCDVLHEDSIGVDVQQVDPLGEYRGQCGTVEKQILDRNVDDDRQVDREFRRVGSAVLKRDGGVGAGIGDKVTGAVNQDADLVVRGFDNEVVQPDVAGCGDRDDGLKCAIRVATQGAWRQRVGQRFGVDLYRWCGLNAGRSKSGVKTAAANDHVVAVLDQHVFEVAAGQDADLAALRGQRLKRRVDRRVLTDAFNAVADRDCAAAACGFAPGLPGHAAVGGGAGIEVDHGERDVMVMDAACGGFGQMAQGAVGAGGEGPEVAGVEHAAGGAQVEGDADAVFREERQCPPRGWGCRRCCRRRQGR